MKNGNEYRENGRLYIRRIRRCACRRKTGDIYMLSCSIIQRGDSEFSYSAKSGYIERRGKKLWLSEDAAQSVRSAVSKLEGALIELPYGYPPVKPPAVYFRRIRTDSYECLCEYTDKNGLGCIEYFENERIGGIIDRLKYLPVCADPENLQEIMLAPTGRTIEKNPVYRAALRQEDGVLRRQILVYYNIAGKNDCLWLSEKLGLRVLPALPAAYDRYYTVDASTVNCSMLVCSGYNMLHRPYFAMRGSTHGKWQLNPHTRTGIDAAECGGETIPFSEYLELFED